MRRSPRLPFDPPRLAFSPELRWVLKAAFATALPGPALRVPLVVELARQLDLTARIAGRCSHEQVSEALNPAAARAFAQHRLAVRAGNRALVGTLQRVAQTAATLGIPLVLLKFAALTALKVIEEGDRDARDIDILVGAEDADRLWQRLVELGFAPVVARRNTEHLPGLLAADRSIVELELRVKGLSLAANSGAARKPITLAELRRENLLLPTPFPDCWTLAPELLAAHATVHALLQHGNTPGYPGMRLLTDLSDLRKRYEILPEATQRFVSEQTSHTLMHSALAVTEMLEVAEPSARLEQEAEPALILRHVIAASCDADYQRSLPLQRALQLRAEGRLLSTALSRLRRSAPYRTLPLADAPSEPQAQLTLRIARDGLNAVSSWLRLKRRGRA